MLSSSYSTNHDLHSFPTRRSSDLITNTLSRFRKHRDGIRDPKAATCRVRNQDEHSGLGFCARLAGDSAVHVHVQPLRSEEHTSELQSQSNLVCRLLLEKKKTAVSQRQHRQCFLHHTAPTTIYTLSLHDALPISLPTLFHGSGNTETGYVTPRLQPAESEIRTSTVVSDSARGLPVILPCTFMCSPSDRKSTRLNSSHSQISYAVFCLKKKKQQ